MVTVKDAICFTNFACRSGDQQHEDRSSRDHAPFFVDHKLDGDASCTDESDLCRRASPLEWSAPIAILPGGVLYFVMVRFRVDRR
jgi:hypothetical protein